jgi:hypothetical protein
MFSIGILGFIVWSHFSLLFLVIKIILEILVVALLFCEKKVTNFANCRQIRMLIDTFICKISISNNQAAGNMILKEFVSSSETTRETSLSFNFSLFSEKYYKDIGKVAPDYNWLV